MRHPLSLLEAIVLAGLTVGGCGGPAVSVDYDISSDKPEAMSTYSWLPSTIGQTGGVALDRAELDRTIRQAVDDVLTSKGYVQTDGDATFNVMYHAVIEESAETVTLDQRGDYLWQELATGETYEPRTMQRTYNQGTLVLDISTPQDRNLYWRASAQAQVHQYASMADRKARIQQAVRDILSAFPDRSVWK